MLTIKQTHTRKWWRLVTKLLVIATLLLPVSFVVIGDSLGSPKQQISGNSTKFKQEQTQTSQMDAASRPVCCMTTPARFASATVDSEPPGMIWIPGGEFTMGTDEEESYAVERPAHRVLLDGYWIDETEVTNDQFRAFVEATGYVTTAERKPDWEQLKTQVRPGTPKPHDSLLVASSLVFTMPSHPVSLASPANWWVWVPGADWLNPEGAGSSIDDRGDHPVVQVSWEDAKAYADWAGKRLPTEAEWEYAARGGLDSKRYAWGDEFQPDGKWMANTWQGNFPNDNSAEDKYARTAPARSFAPNGYGLYEMTGNVWEWCADWYSAKLYTERTGPRIISNPTGPGKSFDPSEPYSSKRVTKGGSFLCTKDYCSNYRPSARRGTDWDTGMSHLGFRCVMSDEKKKAPKE